MQRVYRGISLFAAAQLAISQLALLGMVLAITADVAMRALFNSPIRGTYDTVGILLAISALYAVAAVILERRDIVIDLIDGFVPPRVSTLLQRIWAIVAVAALCFLFWSMLQPMLEAKRYGDTSLELRLPLWLVWIVALGGMAGAVLAAVAIALSPATGSAPVQGEASGE
ncbi:Tripartite ATP-independent periplasmic transporters, DctQ component [Aquimixticola soesokkakensis]|uniref:TRAP transporter small permease protein n=1 Tax=Aquimixticola soesokkakensis TaxID=1519096 RepID=A0A1Y5T0Y7_9RHOB|nr:TRAP transporter small permease [Aquimixticola soesokkakensis]SLN51285.1 Tripartite ATP-independent periplasmic transporters, DctQ component [Aquimixticola soesokkakensis]